MAYAVKEVFYTLQGEGAQTGRAAVFCRFAGCNLWSGRESDRGRAECTFCDTDFIGTNGEGGGKFPTPEALARHILSCWQAGCTQPEGARPYVVFTGGEPLLQLDSPLLQAVRALGFETAVETNGTLPAPPELDWICVSPKTDAPLVQSRGDELKLVYPQAHLRPEMFAGLDFRHFWLQPLDGSALPEPQPASSQAPPLDHDGHLASSRADATAQAVRYCQAHPRWRLSLQTHKLIGIP
ncbi:7-carboxy-7-deazaguanine synthase [Oecophyllibacter saccharovorans]|uniref:7-carboxy-7-deazaguanine synthase n=1 Tax=Oecophyllibacter saccharovorans TaxID=2558360 RepID=A0A506UKJ2_9PROT|nr:7-carboxy-7-deazaguanine synthase [Oecophyllibacter saccharovorans]TPW33846.1 7-carboxy-7-deazaguanine synthase [Oecophyllibacter saccharovorans]